MNRDYSAELHDVVMQIYKVFDKAIKIMGDHKLEMDRVKEERK